MNRLVQEPQNPRGNAVNIWYTITGEDVERT